MSCRKRGREGLVCFGDDGIAWKTLRRGGMCCEELEDDGENVIYLVSSVPCRKGYLITPSAFIHFSLSRRHPNSMLPTQRNIEAPLDHILS